MSLNWNLTDIDNMDDLCFVGKGENKRLNPITEALIWYTLIVGIPEITDKNCNDFHARCEFIDRLGEAPSLGPDGARRTLTFEEVKAHVGLKTNATKMTQFQFVRQKGMFFIKSQLD